MEKPPETGEDLSPEERAAFEEHHRLQAALAAASSYGGGENASGKRPGDINIRAGLATYYQKLGGQ